MHRVMLAALAVAGAVVAAAPVHADPVGGPNEEDGQRKAEYLYHVHQADPSEHRSQDQLLADGKRACDYRRAGHESLDGVGGGVTGAEKAWALTYLCPEVGDF